VIDSVRAGRLSGSRWYPAPFGRSGCRHRPPARAPWRCSPGRQELRSPRAWSPSSPPDEGRPLWLLSAMSASKPFRSTILASLSVTNGGILGLADASRTPRAAAARRAVVARRDSPATATAAMTATGRCCCGHLYSERGGTSSYYCPEGQQLICAECATNGGGLCPTHQAPCTLRSGAP
jgi:hypothetical protein